MNARRESVHEAEALFSKHGMEINATSAEFIADTIFHARRRIRLVKGRTLYSIARYRRALTHAEALLRYLDRPPARGVVAVRARAAKLRNELCDAGVVTNFAVLGAGDLNAVLEQLDAGMLSRVGLETLCKTLRAIADSSDRAPPLGRPRSVATCIVRGGLIAWRNAGRTEKYTFDDAAKGRLHGPLPDFLRDLLKAAGTNHVSDRALKAQIDRNSGLLRLRRAPDD